jgi:hypothetical protein
MNWPLYLIENSLADERRYKREAKKLLSVLMLIRMALLNHH